MQELRACHCARCQSLAGNPCSAAGTAGLGEAGLDLAQGSRHGTHAGATLGMAGRRLVCRARQRLPRVGTALGLYTPQAGALEEVSHQTQHIALMQGTAGWVTGGAKGSGSLGTAAHGASWRGTQLLLFDRCREPALNQPLLGTCVLPGRWDWAVCREPQGWPCLPGSAGVAVVLATTGYLRRG